MRRHLITALLYTIVTTVLFGVVYPFVVTGLAQVLFHDKANGQLLYKDGELVGVLFDSNHQGVATDFAYSNTQARELSDSRLRLRSTFIHDHRLRAMGTMPQTPAHRTTLPPIRS